MSYNGSLDCFLLTFLFYGKRGTYTVFTPIMGSWILTVFNALNILHNIVLSHKIMVG